MMMKIMMMIMMMVTWKISVGFGRHMMLTKIIILNDDLEYLRRVWWTYDLDDNDDISNEDLEYLWWVGWTHCNAIPKTSSGACVWVLVGVIMMIWKLMIV